MGPHAELYRLLSLLCVWSVYAFRLQRIGCLGGQDYRHGAGVLDIQFDSMFTLLTCGYDTIARLWDLRISLHHWSVSFFLSIPHCAYLSVCLYNYRSAEHGAIFCQHGAPGTNLRAGPIIPHGDL